MSRIRTTMLAVACAALLAIPGWSQSSNDQYTQPSQSQQQGSQQPGTSSNPDINQQNLGSQNQAMTGSQASLQGMVIPAGTRVVVRMSDSINSDINAPGSQFRGTLDEPLIVNGSTVAPKGTDVTGIVVQFNPVTTGFNVNEPGVQGSASTGIGSGYMTNQQGNAGATTESGNLAAQQGNINEQGSLGTTNPTPLEQPQSSVQPGTETPNLSASAQTPAGQAGMSGQGQYGTQTGQSNQAMASQSPQLGLVLTSITLNGQAFQLGGVSQTTLTETQKSNTGVSQTAGVTVVDFNRGAPATAVISSGSPVTGIGSGLGTGTQVEIQGSHLNVPSGSVVEFRLQEPLALQTAGSNLQQQQQIPQSQQSPIPQP